MSPKEAPSYTKHTDPPSSRGLSHPKRFITTHDEAGRAVFSEELSEDIPFQQIPNDAIFSLCYATNQTPVDLTENADVSTYESRFSRFFLLLELAH